MYTPIRDYGIIGNRRSAVLVSLRGSIDWAPAPFIDSPSVFGALLDHEKGGFWKIAPLGGYSSRQWYVKDTNILVTEFTTHEGVVEVTDYLPLEMERHYMPQEEDVTFKLKRKVTCVQGSMAIEVVYAPRFNYAQGETTLESIERGVLAVHEHGKAVMVNHRSYEIHDNVARCEARFSEGDSEFFVFRHNMGEVDIKKDSNEHHEEELAETIALHRDWVLNCETGTCQLPSQWQEHLVRSKLVLKNLFFEPTGTIAAAATTSLPEWVGGVRNWDYRFTWLRDSSFLLEAFFKLGHVTEAENYLNWLVNVCAMEGPEKLKIMYGLKSETNLEEKSLPHLEGYMGSRPVRIGNGAHDQRQWDIYGSVIDVAYRLSELTGKAPDTPRWYVLRGIADHVCTIWQEPDEGLWEVRGGARRFTYSALMNWVALDRAIRLNERYSLEGDVETWRTHRRAIRDAIFELGWSDTKQAFTQSFESEDLDAAILLLPTFGFISGNEPKMVATIRAIERELSCGEEGVLIKRYTAEDGLPGEEGAFLLSSFWYVDALVLAGETDRAHLVFERLLSFANHIGLYAEEIHPETKDFLGNFPQAYTHIGLINSALLLSETQDSKRE